MAHRFVNGIRRLWAGTRQLWRNRFGVLPMRSAIKPLNEWFTSPLATVLLSEQQQLIDEQLRNLFGYHLLQLSVSNQVNLLQASRILHRFALHPQAVGCDACVSALADFNHLPLPASSMDVVLLHHVLDYSQNPHQVLREASAVLISRGHLIVLGFNPWSLFGVGRWFAQLFSKSVQWRHQSLRLGRVLDWLAVLDFEPVMVQQGFYRPPLQHPQVIKYLQWLEHWGKRWRLPWGGFYMIVARKDNLAVIPLKPEWQGYAALRGWGVTKILGRAHRETRAQKISNTLK